MVVDGIYARAPILQPAKTLGMTVVSRLRKDAALRTVPGPRRPRRRGRPRVYGGGRIDFWPSRPAASRLDNRGAHLYGKRARKRYKTFVATWRPAGGANRVVLVDEPSGWVAFVFASVSANVAEILSTVADQFSLETIYRNCKEIVEAGQQQVRFVWANIGAFNACLWTFMLTKAWGPVPRGGSSGMIAPNSAELMIRTAARSHADKRGAR